MKISVILFLLFFQTITSQVKIRIPEIIATPGGDIHVPVLVDEFYGISAVSLVIDFDPAVLTFQGSVIQPESFYVNSLDGSVYIAFARIIPIYLGEDTLLVLNFKHLSGNSDLLLTAECETANLNGEVLDVQYISGKVSDPLFQTSSIGDRVWVDNNRNGIQDQNEPGLSWVTVDLFHCNDTWVSFAMTDDEGYYKFSELQSGDYYLQFRLIDNNSKYRFTTMNAGDNPLIDSDAEPINDSTARTPCISVGRGEGLLNYDAGVYFPGNVNNNGYFLSQNYPNPFNPVTIISFSVPVKEAVNISVYNILGQRVSVLLDNVIEEGFHSIEFDAEGLRSGVYFYRLITSTEALTGKMVLAR